MDEIKRRLGYRFVLRSAQFDNSVISGGFLNLSLVMDNVGFAAPFNPRSVEIILRSLDDGTVYSFKLKADPRFWFVGTHHVHERLLIPYDMPSGSYEILLSLPDPAEPLKNNSDFSIRLANENLWEAETGFNKLYHMCDVN